MKSLGTLLRTHRETAGLSQVQVEERTGITQGHVSAIERGARTPSLDVLARLVEAYDLPSDARGELFDAALRDATPTPTPPSPEPA